MTRIIAVANQKGGVGKTTTCASLGAALAELHYKILLVDLDQQGSLTASLGLKPDSLQSTIYDVLASHTDTQIDTPLSLRPIILPRPEVGIDLVPSNIRTAAIERKLGDAISREFILKTVLAEVQNDYDFILLDCPPALSQVVINALAAAHQVIIPLQTEYLAGLGMRDLLYTITVIQKKINPGLEIAGILLTMVDNRTRHSSEVVEVIRQDFSGKVRVFKTMIKESVRLKEAPVVGKPVLQHDPKGIASEAYRSLALEILEEKNG